MLRLCVLLLSMFVICVSVRLSLCSVVMLVVWVRLFGLYVWYLVGVCVGVMRLCCLYSCSVLIEMLSCVVVVDVFKLGVVVFICYFFVVDLLCLV